MPDLTPETSDFVALFQRVHAILMAARHRAMQSVNSEMVFAYWNIGREIVEEEQRGQSRADYGKRIIRDLSERLTAEFGKGYIARNIWYMRDFYLKFPKVNAVRSLLSWTHYRILSSLEKPEARVFYEEECVRANWSTRQLERQIDSMLYERLLIAPEKAALPQTPSELQSEGAAAADVFHFADIIKDPYILEFTGLHGGSELRETDLETALMNHLQAFLLELGRDIFFVSRQQRISVGGDDFYIDLIFYHRILRCFLLIDLKMGKLTHQDIGQMLMYTGYYEQEMTRPDENPPVGLLLCADKNEDVVRYTLHKSQQQIFTSRYQLYLPTEEEIRVTLRRERERLEMEQRLADIPLE